jgi:hypothetical protein
MSFNLDYKQIGLIAIVSLIVIVAYNVAKTKVSQLP